MNMRTNNTFHMLAKAIIALTLLGLCAGAFAQGSHAPRMRRGPSGEWWNNPRTVEVLGLDDATRGLIVEEVHQTKLKMIDLKADVDRANLELQRMLHAESTPPSREVEARVDDFVDAQGRVMKEEILTRARILALLTPEQRAELEAMHQERRDALRHEMRDRRRAPRSDAVPEPPEVPEPPYDE